MEDEPRLGDRGVILVAVDDSDYANVVAEEAARLALDEKSDIVFLSVIPIPSLAPSEGEVDEESLREEEDRFHRLHKDLIDSHFSSSSKILIESKTLHGNPGDKIVKYADEVKADVILVGTRGRGRLASALLGSVSDYVAKHSHRSVLIVRRR